MANSLQRNMITFQKLCCFRMQYKIVREISNAAIAVSKKYPPVLVAVHPVQYLNKKLGEDAQISFSDGKQLKSRYEVSINVSGKSYTKRARSEELAKLEAAKAAIKDLFKMSYEYEKDISDRDPFPTYMNHKVQQILNNITGMDLKKGAEIRPITGPASKPDFKVVPEEELRLMQQKSLNTLAYQIYQQRPPFMNERKEIDLVLSKDPRLVPVLHHNVLFIDTSSYTKKNHEKLVVVRDTEGTLRYANQEERERAIQLAFPRDGKQIFPPNLFKPEVLAVALENVRYDYLLEQLCLQYDPDHPTYIKVSRQIFDHILDKKHFHALRSTRHFGTMAFYFAWTKQHEYLVQDMLERNLVLDAVEYIRLIYLIHQTLECFELEDKSPDEIIMGYMNNEGKRLRSTLQLAYKRIENQDIDNIIKKNIEERNLLLSYINYQKFQRGVVN